MDEIRLAKTATGEYIRTWGEYSEGFIVVDDAWRFNHMDEKGNILSGIWWDNAHRFSDGMAVVSKKDRFNYIDRKGRLLSCKWWERCTDFIGGLAAVSEDGDLYGFIDKSGRYVSDGRWLNLHAYDGGTARYDYVLGDGVRRFGKLQVKGDVIR